MKNMLKRILPLVLAVLLCVPALAAAAEPQARIFGYRFATAEEGAAMLLANRDYYDNMNRNDLNFRMQKADATLEELEAFVPGQMLEFTDGEKAAIDAVMDEIEAICAGRGYRLPATDGIVFVKTTMAEECGAGAYTHGKEIYLGQAVLDYAFSENQWAMIAFRTTVAHELFHCLTRSNPDFRAAMYGILGFTAAEEDYAFGPEIREIIISNPDVDHHNAWATFDIHGEKKDCVVIFTTAEPFRKPGDSFFDSMVTGLVPVDDLNVMYRSEEADNFWDVFGRNTEYVIDPEETLADNFMYTIFFGTDGLIYNTPEIIEAIDAYLRGAGE